METIPDPSPSPAEILMAKEEPEHGDEYGVASRLTLALGSLTKLEAWAALSYMSRPGVGYGGVATFAQCSEATVRRAVAKLRAAVSDPRTGGVGPSNRGVPPPGLGTCKNNQERPRTRRGARAKQTNAKGKK